MSLSSSFASAYIVPFTSDQTTASSEDDVASLPSEPTTDSDFLSDDADSGSDAEEQWRESLQQLELLLTMVIIPFVGKYIGRKCAYWGWTKFMTWKYPLEAHVIDKTAFRSAGVVGAAATL